MRKRDQLFYQVIMKFHPQLHWLSLLSDGKVSPIEEAMWERECEWVSVQEREREKRSMYQIWHMVSSSTGLGKQQYSTYIYIIIHHSISSSCHSWSEQSGQHTHSGRFVFLQHSLVGTAAQPPAHNVGQLKHSTSLYTMSCMVWVIRLVHNYTVSKCSRY